MDIMQMTNKVFDMVAVETELPLGTFTLSLHQVSDFWNIGDRFQKLSDIFRQIVKQLIDEKILFGVSLLRLVIVTPNLPQVAQDWGRQLGKSGETTQHELGQVVGKMYLWGDAKPETTFAIIILQENLVTGFLAEDAYSQEAAKHMFVHEIAHIDTEYLYLSWFGSELPDEWTYIHRSLAHRIWGEFHAEFIAYSVSNDPILKESVEVYGKMLIQAIKDIREEILRYRIHADVNRLFKFTGDLVFVLAAQMGRCLGALHATADSRTNIEKFLNDMTSISECWRDVTAAIYNKVQNGMTSTDDYDELGKIAIRLFHCVGLILEPLPDKTIRINVPFTP